MGIIIHSKDMFKKIFTATLAALTQAYDAPTQAERQSVHDWNFTMKMLGYDYEIHNPVTEDEWVLTMFRILPKRSDTKPNGRSVLFQHGALMDATVWLLGPTFSANKSFDDVHIFLKLADEGYDVWVGNNRGTRYSNENPRWPNADKHDSKNYLYPEENAAKYDFSYFEMGKYDVPSMLDKIIEVSGNEKVSYIGYSQGTAQLFYGLASQEDVYKDKVERAIMLAPCVYANTLGLSYYLETYPIMRLNGINVFNDELALANMTKLCSDFRNAYACGAYTSVMGW